MSVFVCHNADDTSGMFVCVSMVTDLPLQVGGLVRRGSGQNTGVGEARPEQHPHHEDEEDAADHRDGRGQVGRQEGTAANTRTETNKRSEGLS